MSGYFFGNLGKIHVDYYTAFFLIVCFFHNTHIILYTNERKHLLRKNTILYIVRNISVIW